MLHQYKLNGYNIVLDTCSGAVHAVDDVAYDMIAAWQSTDRETLIRQMLSRYADRPDVTEADLRDCADDIAALEADGQLFTPDTFAPMAGTFKERSGDVVKALCLHVAHTCNLNCSYCFASQGKYHGERALMSLEVGKRAIDFLIENSGTRHNLEVDFFGGEPLMNWEVVKQIVAYARSVEKQHNKNFRFTLTTNGMLINDEVIEFANREMSNVVLSLDGRREVHDATRVDYAGHGSYDRIVPKFQKLVAARGGKGYYMRGTFTHRNPDFTKDVLHMADLGFTELSMEPVVAAGRYRDSQAAVRASCDGDASPRTRRQADHLLPLHDRPDRRSLHLQAHFRLRFRNRIHGGHAVGRSVSLPPVRRRGGIQTRGYMERRDKPGTARGIPRLQCLRAP